MSNFYKNGDTLFKCLKRYRDKLLVEFICISENNLSKGVKVVPADDLVPIDGSEYVTADNIITVSSQALGRILQRCS